MDIKFIRLIICLSTTSSIWALLNNDQNNIFKNFPYLKFTQNTRYIDTPLKDGMEFDFIIVGSGSAGAVVANRLSENPNWDILLLELGDIADPNTEIPGLAGALVFTSLNWNYLMEKQEGLCAGLEDELMAWPRGRGLGGSTLINYMIHVRGNRKDYDNWEKAGNTGWSYKDVLPYFIKSEDSLLKFQDEEYHGRGGNLGVQDLAFTSEALNVFIKAAQEAGHKYVDYNGKNQEGVSRVHATQKKGLRCSAEKAFLRPIRYRRNLKISINSRVVKVLIDTLTKTAYGVEVHKQQKIYQIRARKEIISSAGAFNSPQLLMLSGIGPKSHLLDLGITPLVNLPVGQKMYDHLTFLGLVFTVNDSIVLNQETAITAFNMLQLLEGKGIFTALGGVEGLLYFNTENTTDSKLYPNMEAIFISGSLHTDKGQIYRKSYRVTDEVYDAIWKPLEDKYAVSFFPMLVHPKSYGYLKLKSKNPYHWPKLYGNFFTDPENSDIKTLIASIRELQRVMSQPAFQKYKAEIVRTPIPSCKHLEFDTDEYWGCGLRALPHTLHHQIGTCKMGPVNDTEAVVDNKLRVYGVKNLRVVDTSIIPFPPTAHTNVPAYMIGEKASDLIKNDHRN